MSMQLQEVPEKEQYIYLYISTVNIYLCGNLIFTFTLAKHLNTPLQTVLFVSSVDFPPCGPSENGALRQQEIYKDLFDELSLFNPRLGLLTESSN